MKKKIYQILTILVSVAAVLCGILTVALAEEEPGISITRHALSLEKAIYIDYAVECSGFTPTAGNIGMLFWAEQPEDATVESPNALKKQTLGQDNEEETLYIFKYDGLVATQMCDVIWARAYAVVDGKTYYSELDSYSVVTYAARKLGLVEGVAGTENEALKIMLREMLEYGEAAQKYLNYKTEVLPTDIFPENRFTVTFDPAGGSDTPAQTVCRGRRATPPQEPTRDGYTFAGWFNGETEWNFETDTVTENITLTAGWEVTVRYSEGLRFTSNGDGTCSVSGIGTCTDTDINIPPVSPSGDRVVWIGQNAFSRNKKLTCITMPDSVTGIASRAFELCTKLRSVTLSNSLTELNSNVFSDCTELTSVVIPNGVTNIGRCAFDDCPKLVSVSIPDSVTRIEENAFRYCSGLTSLVIPKGVTSISSSSFDYCHGLINITVAEENPVYHSSGDCMIETASKTLVLGCSRSVIPSDGSVTSIGPRAFWSCIGLTGIIIPDGVTEIGSSAFQGCSGLASLSIPDSVTSIGNMAFNACPSLTSITIPGSVTVIGRHAFQGCSGLTSVMILDGVKCIADYAFKNCSGLTSVTVPDSVINVYACAFEGCSGLKSITLPFIPSSFPFSSYFGIYVPSQLRTVVITGGESIGSSVFKGCSGLTSITISDSVTSIGDSAFSDCSGLTSITFRGTIAQWNAIEKGTDWNSNTGNYTIHCTDGDIVKS